MGVSSRVLLSLNNVKSFRDYAVVGGVVQLTDNDLIAHLDNTYAEAVVCNLNVKPGNALRQLSPLMFDAIKNEYQEELQTSLQSQLIQDNDVDIEFHTTNGQS